MSAASQAAWLMLIESLQQVTTAIYWLAWSVSGTGALGMVAAYGLFKLGNRVPRPIVVKSHKAREDFGKDTREYWGAVITPQVW